VLGRLGRSDIGSFALEGAEEPTEQVELLLRPRDVVLERHPEGLGVVVDRRFVGAETIYRVLLRCGITVETSQPPSVELAIGERVEVRCNRARVAAFAGDERIGLAALLERLGRTRSADAEAPVAGGADGAAAS
jgi:iron(III) transport system ATP-binding protein